MAIVNSIICKPAINGAYPYPYFDYYGLFDQANRYVGQLESWKVGKLVSWKVGKLERGKC
jgi:hypothetical protein